MKTEKMRLDDFNIVYHNKAAVKQIISEIFDQQIYQFQSNKLAPFIIDAGSNIGIATLFFKKKYPKAKILCFEPDPNAFSALEQNIALNNLENVKLVAAALANQLEDHIEFFGEMTGESPDARGNSIIKLWGQQRQTLDTLKVPCVRLSDYIHSEVDFLKLDVEGAEQQVIEDLAQTNKLKLIHSMCIEVHQCQGIHSINDMNLMIEVLKAHQFKMEIIEQDLSLLPHQITQWKNRVIPHLFIIKVERDFL